MLKMLGAVKNNKVHPGYLMEHLFQVVVRDEDGDSVLWSGYLIRLEAESYRRPPWNVFPNEWDVFYLVGDDFPAGLHLEACWADQEPPPHFSSGETPRLGRGGGRDYRLVATWQISTPLGVEREVLSVGLWGRPINSLSSSERELLNQVVEEAHREGFGPHGRIVSSPVEIPEKKENS